MPTTRPNSLVQQPNVPPKHALVQVPIEDLQPDPGNPRRDLADLDDLTASISQTGLLQPIAARVEQGRLIVVAGHRRLAALQRLRWSRVPVVVLRDIKADDALVAQLVENGQRCTLDPVEEAHAIHHLLTSQGLTQKEVAARIGRSPATVAARLALLDLDTSTQAHVRAGTLPVGQAVEAVRSTRADGKRRRSDRAWHFGHEHPLAAVAGPACRRARHTSRLAGNVACGPCWETAIREAALAETDARRGAA